MNVAALGVGDAADERLRVGGDLEQQDGAGVDPHGDEVQSDGRHACKQLKNYEHGREASPTLWDTLESYEIVSLGRYVQ